MKRLLFLFAALGWTIIKSLLAENRFDREMAWETFNQLMEDEE